MENLNLRVKSLKKERKRGGFNNFVTQTVKHHKEQLKMQEANPN